MIASIVRHKLLLLFKGDFMRKLLGMVTALLLIGMVYFLICFVCIGVHNSVSREDYARMAQEIVDQGTNTEVKQCQSQNIKQ